MSLIPLFFFLSQTKSVYSADFSAFPLTSWADTPSPAPVSLSESWVQLQESK